MKQCPNPNCTIYTTLEELPDTYLRCPLCKEELVEVSSSPGAPLSAQLFEDQATSPYTPISRPRYVQQPLYGRDPLAIYDDHDTADPQSEIADEGAEANALPSASERALQRARGCTLLAGAFALIAVCAFLVVGVGSRFLPQSQGLGDQGSGIRDQGSVAGSQTASPGPTVALNASPTADPRPPAPIKDALMCARLEAGQPVGSSNAYRPTDTFNLAVQAAFGPGGAETVLTRWYGPDGAPIYDLKQDYTQQGTYYAGFTLKRPNPWPTGDYRVEIYTNNSTQPVQTVSFSVVSQ